MSAAFPKPAPLIVACLALANTGLASSPALAQASGGGKSERGMPEKTGEPPAESERGMPAEAKPAPTPAAGTERAMPPPDEK